MNKHKLNHIGAKPYKCDICKKTYSQFGHVNTNKLVHIGVNPFKCDICEKEFYWSSILNTHKLIHTGVKPFKCDVCDKAFSQSSHLNRQIKLIHAKAKAFKGNYKISTTTKKQKQKTTLFVR